MSIMELTTSQFINNADKILTDQSSHDQFMDFAKANYLSAIEFTHIITIIKSSYIDKIQNTYQTFVKENDNMVNSFREAMGIPEDGSFGVHTLGLTSTLAKMFHNYYKDKTKYNEQSFKNLIKYLTITSIIGTADKKFLLTTGNMFTQLGFILYLDETLINKKKLTNQYGETYSALGFIMLTCPLIFFMVPYNDYPGCDPTILKTGISFYSTITTVINELLLELKITKDEILKGFNSDDKKLLFSKLDLDRIKSYYNEAYKFVKKGVCDIPLKFDGNNTRLEKVKDVSEEVCNGNVAHAGLDARHLALIFSQEPVTPDDKEYSKHFRDLLVNYVNGLTTIDTTNALPIIQLFTRAKMMYYEVYKLCYDVVKDQIADTGLFTSFLSKEGLLELAPKVEKMIKIKYNLLDKINEFLKLKIKGYKDKHIQEIAKEFLSMWTGHDYGYITYPLTLTTEYGTQYPSLISTFQKDIKEWDGYRFALRFYFYTIIMQYIFIKSKEYNSVDYTVYRGLVDNATELDDKNNEYNKKVITESLKDINMNFFGAEDYDNKYSRIIKFCKQMGEKNTYGIDPTVDGVTSETYMQHFKNFRDFAKKYGREQIYDIKELDLKTRRKYNRVVNRLFKLNGPEEWDLKLSDEEIKTLINEYIAYKRSIKTIQESLEPIKTLFKSYKQKIIKDNYIYHQAFSSFTLAKEITDKFREKNTCCVITTKLKPNLPYLYMAGLGKEHEVLFPLFSKFKVVNRSIDNIQLEYLGSNFIVTDEQFIDHVEKYDEFIKLGQKKFYEKYPEYKQKVNTFLDKYHEYYQKIQQDSTIQYGGFNKLFNKVYRLVR